MAMQVESLEVLEKADVAPAQARAIVRAIEIELRSVKDILATKQDVSDLGATLHVEMARQFADLRAEQHTGLSGITRQMYLAILAQMAVLLGFAYFFATHLR